MRRLFLACLLLSAFGGAEAQTCAPTGCVQPLTGVTANNGVLTFTSANNTTSTVNAAAVPAQLTTSTATTPAPGNCPATHWDSTATTPAAGVFTIAPGLPVGCRLSMTQQGNGTVSVVGATGETMSVYSSQSATAGIGASLVVQIDTANTYIVGPGL